MSNISIKEKECQEEFEEDVLVRTAVKKFNNGILAKMIEGKVSETTRLAIINCNHFMMFHADVTLEKRKLVLANSCNNRFCPICAWRKAAKYSLKHLIMLKKLIEDKKYAFIFVTLTSPNVTAERLEEEIRDYAKAFKRFSETKAFDNMNVGYIRKLELTYNKDRNDYNPHYHLLICVKKSYFKSRDYIKQDDWLTMWQLAKRDNNITNVDVRKVKSDNAYLEISKYVAKDFEYLAHKEIFDVFYNSIKGKQIITYNKIFKDLAKQYDAGELDYLKEMDETKYVFKILYEYIFNKKQYEELWTEELTPEEIEKNNKFIDENVFLRKAIELFGTDVEKKDPMKNVKLGEMKKVNSDGTIEK